MIRRFVVLGNPIAHSKSPSIHAIFAEELGLDIQYRRLLVPLDGFAQTVAALRAAGVSGANVTVPFKAEAALLADCPSEAVLFAAAANTLSFTADGIKADNTDGVGLCLDLERLLETSTGALAGSHVVIIGAGGAASGCIQAFKDFDVARLTIINRTASKAIDLANKARQIGLAAEAGDLNAVPSFADSATPKILINASSSSLSGGLPGCPPSLYEWATLAVDMMYGAEPTIFMREVRKYNQHAMIADGLGMLVNQASVSFEIWTGKQPDRKSALAKMRALIANG